MNFDAIADYLDNNQNIKPMAIISALGASSAILANYTATQFGRTFTQFQSQTKFGIESLALLAVVGTIQHLAPYFLSQPLWRCFKTEDDDHHPDRPSQKMAFLISHQLVAACLVGLTAVAARANLIANGLTLFGGVALFASSYCANLAYLKLRNEY